MRSYTWEDLWKNLTFTEEAEHDGRAAREWTEIYCKMMKKVRAEIHEHTLTVDESIDYLKWLHDPKKQSSLDKFLNGFKRRRQRNGV